MLIEHNREKLINAIIYFTKYTKYCGKTKLFKLLFYLDFLHFKQTGKSTTGLDYYAWDFGPVPAELYIEINEPPEDLNKSISFLKNEDGNFIVIKAKKKFNDKYFTKREMKLLSKISDVFRDAKAEHMTEATHLPNEPWHKTIQTKGEKAHIDYLSSLDDEVDSLSIDEVLERIKDRETLKKAFL